jgi:hypothetical protein
VLKEHESLKKLINNETTFNNLSYGYNELIDLQKISLIYYNSDTDGFSNQQKNKNIKNSQDFTFISNSIILFGILIFYIVNVFRIHIIELFFLEKLIYFNSPNFDKYLKNLEEIKKQIQNDNINEEEEKDDIEINDLDSKKISKKDDEEGKKILLSSVKLGKKGKKKDPNKLGKAQKQKSTKIKIMGHFFLKNNIIFIIEIIIILVISGSYYTASLLIKNSKKKNFFDFDLINDEMISVFKGNFDNFIYLKNQLDKFEDTLVNCRQVEGSQILYEMDLPIVSELYSPNFGNNIMKITSDFGFKTETLSNFSSLFSTDACKELAEEEREYITCAQRYGDLLMHGMEHAISKIGSLFGTVIEELNSINDNGSLFMEKMNDSKFHSLELFFELYFQKSMILANNIFTILRSELLSNIQTLLKIVLILYIIIILFLFALLFYFIHRFKKRISSFLFFIAILPSKYMIEDNNLHNEIIRFGNKYY